MKQIKLIMIIQAERLAILIGRLSVFVGRLVNRFCDECERKIYKELHDAR